MNYQDLDRCVYVKVIADLEGTNNHSCMFFIYTDGHYVMHYVRRCNSLLHVVIENLCFVLEVN